MTILAALALALLASQDGDAGLVGRWKFDGDVKDSGSSSLPTKALGRLEFIDSPISGKLAVFNGVDAYVQVEPPGLLGAGKASSSLSFWACPLDKRASPLVSRKGWSLQQADGGALRLLVGKSELATPAGSFPPGRWSHVLVCIKREAEEKTFVSIAINGDIAMSGFLEIPDLDAAAEPLFIGKGPEEGRLYTGLLDDLRLYARALTGEEGKLTDEGMPWLRAKPHAKTPFPGKFELQPNDVIAFTGGENGRVAQQMGYLETLLSLHTAGKHVHFRDMAWEADTVYEQLRPLNFGTWTDQFRRSGTSVVFAQFGQIESLEGKAGLDRFASAYEALLAEFAKTTQRIVLVSPSPFAKGSARQPDLSLRNADLALYVAAIRKIAEKHGYLFVDLTTKPMSAEGLTRDGLHLNGAGQWAAAQETARQLEVPGLSDLDGPDPKGVLRRESLEKLRSAIQYKNGLWNDSWRPANWAFLNGDRMEQPSSRDHQDRRVRWFPVEIQQLPSLIRREEGKIETLVSERK